MRKSRFTESQIVAILKEGEAGVAISELTRKHGISRRMYWRSRYGGVSVSELKRMKEVETENANLKRMYAELALENAAIRDLLSKKAVEPFARRQAAEMLVREHGFSIGRACRATRLSRTAWYRRPRSRMERDRPVIEMLNELVARRPRWGFWKLYDRLRLDSQGINHKHLHRVYCAMKLNLPRQTTRRLPTRIRQPLEAPQALNQIRALDFMADSLYSGRAYRTLNVIDEGNRQVLGIEVAYSIPSLRVIRVLQQLIEMHGTPRALRLDNGPELTSVAFTEWCGAQGIEIRFIQPGKADQNAFIERFNKTYRDEVLDAYVFETIEQVREVTDTWLSEYNEERLHDSLGRVPPLTFLPRPQTARESNFKLCP